MPALPHQAVTKCRLLPSNGGDIILEKAASFSREQSWGGTQMKPSASTNAGSWENGGSQGGEERVWSAHNTQGMHPLHHWGAVTSYINMPHLETAPAKF